MIPTFQQLDHRKKKKTTNHEKIYKYSCCDITDAF